MNHCFFLVAIFGLLVGMTGCHRCCHHGCDSEYEGCVQRIPRRDKDRYYSDYYQSRPVSAEKD